MLIVILAEDDEFFERSSREFRREGNAVVRYRDAVKLADNLPELKPDLLLVRMTDYPWHCELLAAELAFLGKRGSTEVLACFTENFLRTDIPFGTFAVSEELFAPSSTLKKLEPPNLPLKLREALGFGLEQFVDSDRGSPIRGARKRGLVALAKSKQNSWDGSI